MKKYLKIEIEISSEVQAEMLMAILSEINFYAFDGGDNILNAYITEKDFDEQKLIKELPPKTVYRKYTIEEENWNRQWESGITPVRIGDFAAVRPEFSKAVKNVKHDLKITPKMSFGTGHHATTFLMIEMMKDMDFNHKTVVDFGTGTGVLAILAEKCGAAEVIAVDSDEWSINNAAENIKANNCHKITLKQQSDLGGIDVADIVLANINLNVLKTQAYSIGSVSKNNTVFLASGFLVNDEAAIKMIFEKEHFVKIKKESREGWSVILFEKTNFKF